MADELAQKEKRLRDFLLQTERVAVAFSGGVDSSFLLKTAHDLLGERVVAVSGISALQPAAEQERALQVAGFIGSRLIRCDLDPLGWEDFVRNPPDRCYLCKKRIYTEFLAAMSGEGITLLLDGTNADDLREHRPGLRAVQELRVRTPLADAGLGKPEIRRLSREAGLPTWNQFPSSCLATRIPSPEAVTMEKLRFIERSETFLRSLGFEGCRTRLRGKGVTLEIVESCFEKFVNKSTRKLIEKYFCSQGVKGVFLDLSGRPDILFEIS